MTISAIFPYKNGSHSAAALAKALKVPQIRHTGSRFRGNQRKTVINWGSEKVSRETLVCRILNHPHQLQAVRNKLLFFKKMKQAGEAGPRCVPWTEDPKEAQEWLKKKNHVVVRQSLTGHSGSGIIMVPPDKDKVPSAPLYTKYIPKDSEWRVHIVKGQVVDVQRKVRNPDQEPKDWKVRSHRNGFIYIRNTDTPCPVDVTKQAVLSFTGTGLDFGAVDVIFNRKANKAYVLEINSAPGLEGHTVEVYANAFRKL